MTTIIRDFVRPVGLVPIWILSLILKPVLPQDHPWKSQKLTLRSWWIQGTSSAVTLGWCLILNSFFLIWFKL